MQPGDCYIRIDGPITIYGYLIKSKYPEDDAILKASGYVLVEAFSTACVEGEMGTEHPLNIVPITRETFDVARERHWPSFIAFAWSLSHDPLFAEFLGGLKEE